MKTKNTFKKPVITYAPITQPKRPYWTHSIMGHNSGDTGEAIKSVLMIIAFVTVVIVLAYLKFG